MFDFELPFINEQFYSFHRESHEMDALWNDGWRHFGTNFFRYNFGLYKGDVQPVVPLRINVKEFSPSQGQRRVWRANADLQIIIRPAEITEEKHEIFERHKRRFDHAVPDTIHDFIFSNSATVPCQTSELCVYHGDRLLAATFLDIGKRSTSAVYAMFEPSEAKRSLGIFMILKEIEYSRQEGKDHLHLGYAYRGPSFYDYKKRFGALEAFDWRGNWAPYDRSEPGAVATG
jgi:arginine-tRNA-protein transferase